MRAHFLIRLIAHHYIDTANRFSVIALAGRACNRLETDPNSSQQASPFRLTAPAAGNSLEESGFL
jgi:hypothetical protein